MPETLFPLFRGGDSDVSRPTLESGPRSAPPAERQRLNRQCREILARLTRGPASNDALSKIARKYTGRISEIRRAGYDVECFRQDRFTGLSWYRLNEED